MSTIIFREKYGSSTKENTFIKSDVKHVTHVTSESTIKLTYFDRICLFWRAVLLPIGWPNSVSGDYLSYQIWDSAQAFCSGLTGALATRAVLAGVGVGNATATPLAAAISWIVKDGTGLIGRILFVWWKGLDLDSDCKKWRLFADFINDCAMCIELLIPYFMHYSTLLLCISSTMKALVGVAGGATRASITQHQALKGNVGDVAAKDASQETCVNLFTSVFSIVLLYTFNEGWYDWPLFILFTFLHLLTNYLAVKALIMTNLNDARYNLLLQEFIQFNKVYSPAYINDKESVILGSKLKAQDICNFDIKMGVSVRELLNKVPYEDFMKLVDTFKDCNYLIIPDIKNRILYVVFHENEKSDDIVKGYFHAIIFGLISLDNNEGILKNNDPHEIRSYSLEKMSANSSLSVPVKAMNEMKKFITTLYKKFENELILKGWSVDSNLIKVDEWRAKWHSLD